MPATAYRSPGQRRQAGRGIVCVAAMVLAVVAWWSDPARQQAVRGENEGLGEGPRSLQFQLDLNRASVQELMLLPGIGPALAERIVEHRVLHGAFDAVEALDEVRGIGPSKLRQAAPYLRVSAELPLSP